MQDLRESLERAPQSRVWTHKYRIRGTERPVSLLLARTERSRLPGWEFLLADRRPDKYQSTGQLQGLRTLVVSSCTTKSMRVKLTDIESRINT